MGKSSSTCARAHELAMARQGNTSPDRAAERYRKPALQSESRSRSQGSMPCVASSPKRAEAYSGHRRLPNRRLCTAARRATRPHCPFHSLTKPRSSEEYMVYATATYMLLMNRSRGTTELNRLFPFSVTRYWSFKNCTIRSFFWAADIVASSGVVTEYPYTWCTGADMHAARTLPPKSPPTCVRELLLPVASSSKAVHGVQKMRKPAVAMMLRKMWIPKPGPNGL
mmetsp:Transcript_76183/g.210711  ORF Transcript_76183/g.210711 Transcript_76183/m.210711 type:complete len:225 (+) Transcript_76183:52-726(+)